MAANIANGVGRDFNSSPMDKVYSSESLVDKAVELIYDWWIESDKNFVFVDFSAGDDILCCKLRNFGITCYAFDIDPKTPKTVCKKSWFDVKNKFKFKNCVVGFNPPFGRSGCAARKFLEETLYFKPLKIISVVPRCIRHISLENYKLTSCDVLNPVKSFRNKGGRSQFGTFLCIWDYCEGYIAPIIKKTRVKWPEGINFVCRPKKWDLKNHLYIRRQGWKPGEKLVWIDEYENLYMLSPDGDFTLLECSTEINNSLTYYTAFHSRDGWICTDIEVVMREIQKRVQALGIDRNEFMMPNISSEQLYSVLLPAFNI